MVADKLNNVHPKTCPVSRRTVFVVINVVKTRKILPWQRSVRLIEADGYWKYRGGTCKLIIRLVDDKCDKILQFPLFRNEFHNVGI